LPFLVGKPWREAADGVRRKARDGVSRPLGGELKAVGGQLALEVDAPLRALLGV
jgi:hypothetical protein